MKKILRYNKEKGCVEEFDAARDPVEMLFLGNNKWAVGGESIGAGCHSSQVDEFRRDAADAGLTGVEFTDRGTVKFGSRRARRDYMRFRNLYDRDAGYGDAAPNDF